jgi:uncharacterized protein (TIGR02646 family)
MILLNSKNLSGTTSTHLIAKQAAIDGKANFVEQSQRAGSLWNAKTGTTSGRNAFSEIKSTLIEMCVGVEICNFCENNEATDIEHIYPKSHFPERAFIWDNYLLACKICNTTYKSDKFSVFNPANSNSKYIIQRGSPKPPTNDSVLLNPRIEDPMQFLFLDIKGNTFRFGTLPNLSIRDKEKADYTIELLGLNDRDTLVEGRRAAAHYFISRLEKFVLIKEAIDFPSLESIVSDLDFLDLTNSLANEKIRLMASVKTEILKYSHPTIWKEFIRQKNHLPKTNNLFTRAPEALTWI